MPNSCTCSLPAKSPVYQCITLAYTSPKMPVNPGPSYCQLRSAPQTLPPTYHQLSQCLVPCAAPRCRFLACCQICRTHQQSHLIASYRATGLQSHPGAVQQGRPRTPTGHALAAVATLCFALQVSFPVTVAWWRARPPEIHQKKFQEVRWLDDIIKNELGKVHARN